MYEIYWRLEKIIVRNNLDREFSASLHGLKLDKPKELIKKQNDSLSKNQEEALEIALKRAKERKRLEFKRG